MFLKIWATRGSKHNHSNPDQEPFHFKVLFSRIHKNAAGVNELKPPELHRVWQFIIQQGFSPTQFSFFSLLIIECLGQLVVSGYLLPQPNYTPKCINIFRRIIFIDRRSYLPSQRIEQSGLELRDENV